MLAVLVCALAVQVPIEQPPRLRTRLPNGAVVLIEKVPHARSIVVDLFVSARGVRENAETHGIRHLIEHLCAKGRRGDLDARLESQGAFLLPRTLRDASEFRITVPAGNLKLALSAASELTQLGPLTPDSIAKEVGILAEEGALRDMPARLSTAAWLAAYGQAGLDPFGDLARLSSATPETIGRIHRDMFRGGNLAIVVSGDVDLDAATKAAASVVGSAATGTAAEPPRVTQPSSRVEIDGLGEARAASVSGYADPGTIATLAAAFAVASEVDGAFVTYTPSIDAGLVIVGRAGENAGVGRAVDSADANLLFTRGKILVRRWLRAQMDDPIAAASLRGLLLTQSHGARPESIADVIDALSPDQFRKGLERLSSDRGYTVIGR